MARVDLVSRDIISSAVDTLVGSEPLMFSRAVTIQCTGSGLKPMTAMNVFIDGELHNSISRGFDWAGSQYGKPGARFRSNTSGDVKFIIDLPAGKFKTGNIDIVVTDGDTPSSGTSRASSVFHSSGTLQVFTRTKSNLVVDRITHPYDPVAQGFFTFGAGGPVSITSIELFFASKDEVIPLQLQVRKMVGGMPDFNFVSPDAVVNLPAAQVKVTGDKDNFKSGTVFKFPVPIVLEQDQQYCFVVQSNSNAYNLYMASQGEASFETKKVIFEQPYIGVMFKSANNFTWTPMQNSALKFRINRAVYQDVQSPKVVKLGGNSSSRMILGSQFITKNGSNKIIFKSNEQHGYSGDLSDNETISISPNIPSVPSKTLGELSSFGDYNGFTVGQLSGNRPITRVIDNYTIEFSTAGGAATKSGPINSSGMVTNIITRGLDANSPYPNAPSGSPVVFPYRSGNTAIPIDYLNPINTPAGVPFRNIELSDPGKGYYDNFELPVGGTDTLVGFVKGITGANVTVQCYTDASFVVDMVKPISMFTTNIGHMIPDGADLKISHAFTTSGGKSLTEFYDTNLSGPNFVPDNVGGVVIATNNTTNRNSAPELKTGSIVFKVEMSSNSDTISPMYNFTSGASVSTYANIINDQGFTEDISSSVAASSITSITVTEAGSGYSAAPIVTIVPAEDEPNVSNIVAATATATISNTSVTGITVTSAGSGYTRPPIVMISAPQGGVNRASALSNINKINSELLPNNGNALGRYLTKAFKLAMPSTGIRIRSKIVSTPDTSVDWYIKSAMNDTPGVLDSLQWKHIPCPIPRNMSRTMHDTFEYEFNLDGLPEFNVYKLKAVMSSKNRNVTPYIKDYKVIITG